MFMFMFNSLVSQVKSSQVTRVYSLTLLSASIEDTLAQEIADPNAGKRNRRR